MDDSQKKTDDPTGSATQIDTSLVDRVAKSIVDTLVFSSEPRRAALIPDLGQVVELIERLNSVVFPIFCAVEQSREIVHQQLQTEVADVGTLLVNLIRSCILRNEESCVAMRKEGRECKDAIARSIELASNVDAISQQLAESFLQQIPAIRTSLMTDVQAAYDGDPACQNYDEVILCYPGLTAIMVHRLAHEIYKLEIPFLARMMAEWSHAETGIDIHPGAKIDDYFFIDHGTGVVIGETCQIGKHVKIYQGVTLGAISFDKDERGQLVRGSKRHPTIEDHVVIYANATVLGGNTVIGEGTIVGSSVWITRSVEPRTTVTMKKPSLKEQKS